MIDEKLLFLNMATYYQQKMGYKVSWIQVVFKEKFGVWPNELLKQKTPIESTDEFIEWIKKYQSRSFLNTDEITKKTLEEADKLKLYEKEERKLISLSRRIPRKGKTAREIAEKFGISIRSVQTYTSMPRDEYEAHSITRSAPWDELGMSRATWYRKGKPMSASPSEQAPSQEKQHATNSHRLREREIPA